MKKSLFPALLLVLALSTAAFAWDPRTWGTDAMVTTQIIDRAVNSRVMSELPRQQVASGDSYPVSIWASQSYEQITVKKNGGWTGFRETQHVSLAGVDIHLPSLLAGISLGRSYAEGAGDGFGNNRMTIDGTLITPYLGLQLGENLFASVFYSRGELHEDRRTNVNRHEQRVSNAVGLTGDYLLRFDALLLDVHAGSRFAGSDARGEDTGQLAQWRAGVDAKYKWNGFTFVLGADYVEDFREYAGYGTNRTQVYDKNEVAVRAGVDYALSDALGLKLEGNKSFFREKYTQYGADLQLSCRF